MKKTLGLVLLLVGCQAENPWLRYGYTDFEKKALSFGECGKYSYTLKYEAKATDGTVEGLGVCCKWRDVLRHSECTSVY